MKVIGVVGLPASGKGEFSKIATDMGIPVVVMGDMIRAAVKAAGLEPTDANFGMMANNLRTERGMDAVAHSASPRSSASLRLSYSLTGSGAMQKSYCSAGILKDLPLSGSSLRSKTGFHGLQPGHVRMIFVPLMPCTTAMNAN